MIAVTGASGHIGANLVRELCAAGQPVRALVHRRREALDGLAAEQVEADVLNPAQLRVAFDAVDTVYHLAGYVSMLDADAGRLHRINVEGTACVLDACRQAGVRRFVHFSSVRVLSPTPLSVPLTESRHLRSPDAGSAYDRSKTAAEVLVRRAIEQGMDALILYPTGVLGPNDFGPSELGRALLGLACGRLPALVNGGCDWVDARDVALGAMAAAQRGARGASYLLGGHYLRMEQVAAQVQHLCGVPAPRFIAPMWLARAAAPAVVGLARALGQRPLFTPAALAALRGNPRIDHSKAAADLGYRPRPFIGSLRDSLAWYRQMGMLSGGTK